MSVKGSLLVLNYYRSAVRECYCLYLKITLKLREKAFTDLHLFSDRRNQCMRIAVGSCNSASLPDTPVCLLY